MQPYFDDGQIQIYHGKAEEVLPALEGGFGVVVTDPPYGTGRWARKEAGQGSNPSGNHRKDEWDSGSVEWLSLIPTAVPVLTFWPCIHLHKLLAAAVQCDRVKHRQLYMRKRDPMPSMTGVTQWAVEPIWCLSEEGFHLRGGEDIIDVSTPRKGRDAEATGHPCEKPLACLRWLIGKLTQPGTVLDPFLGSGTTLRAAKDAGLKAIGVEINEAYCEIAARRLSQQVFQWA